MGNTATRPSASVVPVPVSPATVSATEQILRPFLRYTLEIQANIVPTEEGAPLQKEYRKAAKTQLRDTDLWSFYLSHAMKDALEDEIQSLYTGTSTLDIDIPEIPVRDTTLRFYRKWTDETSGNYTLTLSWTSAECNLEFLSSSLKWRIGDRMSMYEITDEDGEWHTFLTPGTLRAEPLEKLP